MRAVAILNAKAGLVLQQGEAIARTVTEAFRAAGHAIDVTCVEPDEIEAAINAAAVRDDIDTLIIGGGDGTQSLAAGKLAGTAIALGVLPFGTVNLLGRDLRIPLAIEDAVAALAGAERTRIDLAEVNGRTFHSLLGLGFFARLAGERQRARVQIPFARSLAFILAFCRALSRVGSMQIAFEAENAKTTRRSTALMITNNRYREQPLQRDRLDQGVLEINVVRGARLPALLNAGVDLAAGHWRRGHTIDQFAVSEVTITTRRPQVQASVDGETVVLQSPLKVRVRPQVLTVLRPRAG